MDSLNLYDMRFKRGQQVVCIREGSREYVQGVDNYGGTGVGLRPGFNEVVTVAGYSRLHRNCIMLYEYDYVPPGCDWPNCFSAKAFAPLADITEIHEILSAEPQTEIA